MPMLSIKTKTLIILAILCTSCSHNSSALTPKSSADELLRKTFKSEYADKFILEHSETDLQNESSFTYKLKECKVIVIVDTKLYADIGGVTKECDNYY